MTTSKSTDSTPQTQLQLFDAALIPYNVVRIPLSPNGKYAGQYEAIVDAVDADLVDRWWAIINIHHSKTGHAIHSKGRKNKRRFWMHRVIMERVLNRPLERGEIVDHINGNGLDNRRSNLRLATHSQNNVNKGLDSKNTSGYKGVHWRPDKRKWHAEIRFEGKRVRLGYFNSAEAAYQAYCEAAKEMHGEFVRLE